MAACLGACCFPATYLLACCLLAKPVRSTLDTKEGCKTKIIYPSSVALTRIECQDQAGGGKNTVYETPMINEVRIGTWMRAAEKGLRMMYIHPFGPLD